MQRRAIWHGEDGSAVLAGRPELLTLEELAAAVGTEHRDVPIDQVNRPAALFRLGLDEDQLVGAALVLERALHLEGAAPEIQIIPQQPRRFA